MCHLEPAVAAARNVIGLCGFVADSTRGQFTKKIWKYANHFGASNKRPNVSNLLALEMVKERAKRLCQIQVLNICNYRFAVYNELI